MQSCVFVYVTGVRYDDGNGEGEVFEWDRRGEVLPATKVVTSVACEWEGQCERDERIEVLMDCSWRWWVAREQGNCK